MVGSKGMVARNRKKGAGRQMTKTPVGNNVWQTVSEALKMTKVSGLPWQC